MKIEVLGIGCATCKTLYEAVQAAVKEQGVRRRSSARGVANFSLCSKRISGAVVALVGGWFVWQGL